MNEAEDRYRKMVPAHERPFAHRLYVQDHPHPHGDGRDLSHEATEPARGSFTDAAASSAGYFPATQVSKRGHATAQPRSDALGGEEEGKVEGAGGQKSPQLNSLESLSPRESAALLRPLTGCLPSWQRERDTRTRQRFEAPSAVHWASE